MGSVEGKEGWGSGEGRKKGRGFTGARTRDEASPPHGAGAPRFRDRAGHRPRTPSRERTKLRERKEGSMPGGILLGE